MLGCRAGIVALAYQASDVGFFSTVRVACSNLPYLVLKLWLL